MGKNPNQQPPEEDLPDTMRHVGHNLEETLGDVIAAADGDDEAIRRTAKEAAKRKLDVLHTDLTNEIEGGDAEARELQLHYEETGDTGIATALDSKREDHHKALVDKLNLPPKSK